MVDYMYWVIIDGLITQTPLAYLISVDGKEIWIQKSCSGTPRINDKTENEEALEIEMWVIIKKGLESYIEEK